MFDRVEFGWIKVRFQIGGDGTKGMRYSLTVLGVRRCRWRIPAWLRSVQVEGKLEFELWLFDHEKHLKNVFSDWIGCWIPSSLIALDLFPLHRSGLGFNTPLRLVCFAIHTKFPITPPCLPSLLGLGPWMGIAPTRLCTLFCYHLPPCLSFLLTFYSNFCYFNFCYSLSIICHELIYKLIDS